MLRFSVLLRRSNLSGCRLWFSTGEPNKEVNTKQVLMELRRKTGYPLITCRQALQASGYNVEKAKEHLLQLAKEKGWNTMQMDGGVLKEGLISVVTNKNNGLIVEVNCQTDFVAKTKEFQSLVKDAAQTLLDVYSTQQPSKIDLNPPELLKLVVSGKKQTIEDTVAITIGKLKEKIEIRRASLLSVPTNSILAVYIHPSVLISKTRPGSTLGSYGAMVSLSPTDENTGKSSIKMAGRDIAQHIVGMNPSCIGTCLKPTPNKSVTDSTPDDDVINPPEMLSPDESSHELLKQPFLLDSSISVAHWLNYHQLNVNDFIRFQVGEKTKSAEK
uniref:Elongation factor Ts, mitochondrial n=1 Tax=Ciona intestinalis TaxID=7719 RepID=F6ZVT2_CIOIN|nr:elongation factor Ts, mitochondrial isoform X1 [Ciona intestinalis]|eukprot:XP_002129433.1 elongation factor Ts, mitochondrial isoform X1 [Ciona intestinalis]